MMRYDSHNLHVYPVRMEMTSTKHITTSHVCSTDERILKEFLVGKTLSRICYRDNNESKGIIVDDFFTEEDES